MMRASARSPPSRSSAAFLFSASVISWGLGHSSLISMTASFVCVGLSGQFAAVMVSHRPFPRPREDRDSYQVGSVFRAGGQALAIPLQLRQVFPGDHAGQQAQPLPDPAVTL